jgi:ketosteroid isomerase-like protein
MSAVPESRGPREADRQFFAALLAANVEVLRDLLADDFVLIDVFQGGEIPRESLLDAIAGRAVRFEAVEVLESRERRYGDVALITGRTEMRGHGEGQAWAVSSRYTHVFVQQQGRWRLVAAQGTRIAGG